MLEEMAYEFDFIEKRVKDLGKSEQVVLSRQSSLKRGLDDEKPKMVEKMTCEAESQGGATEGRRDKFESERTDPAVVIRSHLETCISGPSAGPGFSILKGLQAPRGAKILQLAMSLPGVSTAIPKTTRMRKETSGTSASQGPSSKFIKSSIPMKFNPVKPDVEKLSPSEELARLNKLVEVDSGAYSSIKPSKRRVAHTKEPSSSSQDIVGCLLQSMTFSRPIGMEQEAAVKPRTTPEVYPNVAMEEVVGGFATVAENSSSEALTSSLAAMLGNEDIMTQQEALDNQAKKCKKDKKNKKNKKIKHKGKARQYDESSLESDDIKPHQSVQVNPSTSDTKLNLVQPPLLRLVIKKATDGSKNYSSVLC